MTDEKATLSFAGRDFGFPVVPATTGSIGLDISKFRAESGVCNVRPGVCEHCVDEVEPDVHQRRRGSAAPPRLPDRGPRRALHLPRGDVPLAVRQPADAHRARHLDELDSRPHAAQRGDEALLRRVSAQRPSHGDPLVGDECHLDVVRSVLQPVRPGCGHRIRQAPHRQNADDRRLGVQEVHRSALRLPPQRPHLRRELPAHDVRPPRRVDGGRSHHRQGAQRPPRPPRRSRPETARRPRSASSAPAGRTCSPRWPPG